jgi:signal transduction histidine kinase
MTDQTIKCPKCGTEILSESETEIFREKMNQLQSLLAVASHEFKGPLHNILSLMSLLDTSDSSTSKIRQQMIEEVYRAKRTVDNYLLTGITQLKYNYRLNKIGDSIRRCVSRFQSNAVKKGVAIKVLASATNLPEIAYNRDQIELVLMNIIDNAVKYSFDNTEIIIEGQDKENTITVSISDMGLGIPIDMREKIFGGSQRTVKDNRIYRPGTGLGLMIAKKIAEEHKGNIFIESEPLWGDPKRLVKNEGFKTKFILSLPKNLPIRA